MGISECWTLILLFLNMMTWIECCANSSMWGSYIPPMIPKSTRMLLHREQQGYTPDDPYVRQCISFLSYMYTIDLLYTFYVLTYMVIQGDFVSPFGFCEISQMFPEVSGLLCFVLTLMTSYDSTWLSVIFPDFFWLFSIFYGFLLIFCDFSWFLQDFSEILLKLWDFPIRDTPGSK